MSSAAVRIAPAPGVRSYSPVAEFEERDSLVLRLVAFVALAAFGVDHWWTLVTDRSTGRAVAIVAIATAAACLLGLLARLRLQRSLTVGLAVAVALGALAAGLVAAGLAPRLLLPGHWNELADGLDRGLSGVRTADWPYRGPDTWVRLTILLGAPLLLTVAAAAAFWPARRRQRVARAAGLVALLVLYGVAVTNHDPGSPLSRGFLLLLLVGAWLWLPRLGRRDALAAAAATLAVGVLSLPVASALDSDKPLWDYRSWDWFGGGKTVVYDWNHSYGPLDWPRDGTTLLNIKSSQPLYWKAEALDQFDGVRWLRVPGTHGNALPELPGGLRPRGRHWSYFEFNPRWNEHVRVTVRSLHSDLVVGPGTIYEVNGAGSAVTTEDGTTLKLDETLEKGDTYTVSSYVPDPTVAQMRGVPTGFSLDLDRYTTLRLQGGREVVMPLRSDSTTGTPGAARDLMHSPYAGVYDLVRRVSAGAATSYDAVARVERYLQRGYTYDENPPRRRLPLAAFLLRDKRGYCQQFSGAMALMLRMIGIPSRVAAGFTPGSYNSDTSEFRVRDLDAHSWVEVYFTGIGWVTFDPTPPAAPAQTQSSGLETFAGSGGQAGDVQTKGGDTATPDTPSDTRVPGGRDGGGPSWWIAPVALGLVALAAGGWLAARFLMRRRPLTPEETVEALLQELESALPRLGWRLPVGTTLLALERRLVRMAGPEASTYAARLRAHRYEVLAPEAPDRPARRAFRRALAAAAGRGGRLRALWAIPPGGPFRRF